LWERHASEGGDPSDDYEMKTSGAGKEEAGQSKGRIEVQFYLGAALGNVIEVAKEQFNLFTLSPAGR
jgi:hypothetical protein